MANATEIKAFKGFKAILDGSTENRKTVWVCNSGTTRDGKRALKVQIGAYLGCTGWSGGCHEQYKYAEKKIWVLADRVSRRGVK